jgi:GR25 family glycosyltransferase involved in LPS biosynthesis
LVIEEPFFEPVPRHADCDYCAGRRDPAPLEPIAHAAYCISLQEQPERTATASALFHRLGLCRHVTFYRPRRGANTTRAVWASHRAVAERALAAGQARTLMLEDDVWMSRPWVETAPRIARALSRLPDDWWGFYLGHFPLKGYFVAPQVMRVRSACTHAYVANRPLLDWLVTTVPGDPVAPVWERAGTGVDAAFAMLGEMYALFPMVARQRRTGGRRIDPVRAAAGRRRPLLDPARYRESLIFHGLRPAELLAAALSPYHRRTFDSATAAGLAFARTAAAIRASGQFDPGYYLARYPDVARSEVDPLGHYMRYGAREGRWPSAAAAGAGTDPLAPLLAPRSG